MFKHIFRTAAIAAVGIGVAVLADILIPEPVNANETAIDVPATDVVNDQEPKAE